MTVTIGASPACTTRASVRLNGVPVIQVTASGDESATARAARIGRRLERLADRIEETARPTVVHGPTGDALFALITVTTGGLILYHVI